MKNNESRRSSQNKTRVNSKVNKSRTIQKSKQPIKKSSLQKTSKKKINTKVNTKNQKNNKSSKVKKKIEKTTVLNVPKKETLSKLEDAFKVEKEEPKKVEIPKKKVTIEKLKRILNKPKKKKETEEEKKKKRKFIIILLLLLIFFFFILNIDDLITGKPLKPKVTAVEDVWYKEKIVKIETDSITRKELSHYLYCIRQDKNINKCESH